MGTSFKLAGRPRRAGSAQEFLEPFKGLLSDRFKVMVTVLRGGKRFTS